MWPRYAQELETTVMLIVPSSVALAARARMLPRGALPKLRLAFLGAEAVTRNVVQVMGEAAPNAQFVNLWGPTEATVFFTHFRIDPKAELPDVIPIGHPFPGQMLQVWDEGGRVLRAGEAGELMQSGSQVTHGYWRNPDADAQRFAVQAGLRWYRSGDLAVFDPQVGYRYLGRVDRQVKVRGYRVELQECESAVRDAARCSQAAVVPLIRDGEVSADSLVCFVVEPKVDVGELADLLKGRLPEYMVPARFIVTDELPLGVTGKTDYRALQERLREAA
jgi:non-ribosomal peptide synthetase component F